MYMIVRNRNHDTFISAILRKIIAPRERLTSVLSKRDELTSAPVPKYVIWVINYAARYAHAE